MRCDTALVAVGIDVDQVVLVAMSRGLAEVHENDPDFIEGFLEEGVPRVAGLWLWECNYEDDNTEGEWRRPTSEEIEAMSNQENAA